MQKALSSKIVKLDEIEVLSDLKGKKVVVGGCFDILHFGHTTFLKNAKKEGDTLIVLLESDEFIRKQKKREPYHIQKERAEILAHLDIIDYVLELPLIEEGQGYLDLIKKIKPQIIAVTEGDSKITFKKQHAEKVGAVVKVVSNILPFSSTKYATFFRD